MGKPSCGYSVALLFLLLVSCGEVSVAIRFDSLTSGQVTLSYLVLPEFSGVGGRVHPLGWPVGQAEWAAFASRIQGVTLVSQNVVEEGLGNRVTGVLRFANLLALEGISVQLGQRLTVIPVQNVYTMTFNYQVPDTSAFGERARSLATVYLQGSSISWSVQTPRLLREATRGTVGADNRSFSFSDDFSSILQNAAPPIRAQW